MALRSPTMNDIAQISCASRSFVYLPEDLCKKLSPFLKLDILLLSGKNSLCVLDTSYQIGDLQIFSPTRWVFTFLMVSFKHRSFNIEY